jgi:hypothetical protein
MWGEPQKRNKKVVNLTRGCAGFVALQAMCTDSLGGGEQKVLGVDQWVISGMPMGAGG